VLGEVPRLRDRGTRRTARQALPSGIVVEQASSASDFLAIPMGRYFRGARYVVFAHSPTLLGFASWGRPGVEDVRELLSVCQVGLKPGMVPYRWFVDLRGLELIEPATFGLFLDHTRRNRELLRCNIARQAQLRPSGLVGAIVTGFAPLAMLPYPDRVFADVGEAFAWLALDHQEGVGLVAELDAIRSAACDSHSIVARLRQELEMSGSLAIEDAARRFALSTRGLQRALRQAGTTYRMELKAFQIRRAQQLLRRGEQSLTSIAAEVGFASSQHFATAYRRAVGDTPSAWRARHVERPSEIVEVAAAPNPTGQRNNSRTV
jgi:AraC-like DNA-binding protein